MRWMQTDERAQPYQTARSPHRFRSPGDLDRWPHALGDGARRALPGENPRHQVALDVSEHRRFSLLYLPAADAGTAEIRSPQAARGGTGVWSRADGSFLVCCRVRGLGSLRTLPVAGIFFVARRRHLLADAR